MTFSRRIALAAAAAVALAVIVASAVVYVTARHTLRAQVDDALRAIVPDVRVSGAPDRILVRRFDAALAGAKATVPVDPLGGATGIAQVVTPKGEVVLSSKGPRLPVDRQGPPARP